jgi:DNA processing protein
MSWEKSEKILNEQPKLFVELGIEEQRIYDCIISSKEISIDKIAITTGIKPSTVASTLIKLEFEGLVRALPGKLYKIS